MMPLTHDCSCSSVRRWTDTEPTRLLVYTEVGWLSEGRSLFRVSELPEMLQRFVLEKESLQAAHFTDTEWATKLAHLCGTFKLLNELNLSLQWISKLCSSQQIKWLH